MLDSLVDRGYLTYLTEKSRSSYIKCEFNIAHYYEECSNGYAVIYLDELEKIMSYKKENTKGNTINNTAILLVFAYLRNKIRRRPNELMPEERTSAAIRKRKEKLGISENQIRDAANIKTKSIESRANKMTSAERELELERAAAKKANAKSGSMAAKANRVKEFNERNSK